MHDVSNQMSQSAFTNFGYGLLPPTNRLIFVFLASVRQYAFVNDLLYQFLGANVAALSRHEQLIVRYKNAFS